MSFKVFFLQVANLLVVEVLLFDHHPVDLLGVEAAVDWLFVEPLEAAAAVD